jgi:O-antigen/teichoic acid export membrane protein
LSEPLVRRAGGPAPFSEGGAGSPAEDSFVSGARILSIGIAATGVFTFAYFAVSSHVLGKDEYGAISTLWAILFVTISVIYRPVEQLLSRTIADARARGVHQHELRGPATIQLAFAGLFFD